jgi:hypothetical protein
MNQKVCFIAGAGHSGSTLLGLILGSHTSCFHGGEIAHKGYKGYLKYLALAHALPNGIPVEAAATRRICKFCGANCPVWGDFVESPTVDLYEQLAIKTGKPIIIDSTKKAAWIAQQIATLKDTPAQCSLLYLQRDGRAVLNSQIRKHPHTSPRLLIEKWLQQIQAAQTLFERFDGGKLIIHYEALATVPGEIISQICDFLGITYDADMLNFHQHEHHPLGGNCGTQFLAARTQRLHPEQMLIDRTRAYYAQHPAEIRLDLRWRHELQPDIRRLFEELAGAANANMQWEEAERYETN